LNPAARVGLPGTATIHLRALLATAAGFLLTPSVKQINIVAEVTFRETLLPTLLKPAEYGIQEANRPNPARVAALNSTQTIVPSSLALGSSHNFRFRTSVAWINEIADESLSR
jgi:hypothetical protein